MVKVIVRPGHMAYIHNVRWREGELVDVEIKNGKMPKWAMPADTKEAKAAVEQIKARTKERQHKSYAPSALVEKNTPIAD
jgi:hypothetical protein